MGDIVPCAVHRSGISFAAADGDGRSSGGFILSQEDVNIIMPYPYPAEM